MASRAHVVLPEDLLEQVDKIAGKRKRSTLVEEAIREKLSREGLRLALAKTKGILQDYNYPEWSTPEKTSEWVRSLRRADDERLARKSASSEE